MVIASRVGEGTLWSPLGGGRFPAPANPRAPPPPPHTPPPPARAGMGLKPCPGGIHPTPPRPTPPPAPTERCQISSCIVQPTPERCGVSPPFSLIPPPEAGTRERRPE